MNLIQWYAQRENLNEEEARADLLFREAMIQHGPAFRSICLKMHQKLCEVAAVTPIDNPSKWGYLRGKADSLLDISREVEKVTQDLISLEAEFLRTQGEEDHD